MKLTVETDDTMKMKTLVVLADIVINSERCDLEYFQIDDEICFFADLFKMYLAEDDFVLSRTYHEGEELVAMSRSLESVVTVMRELLEQIKEPNAD